MVRCPGQDLRFWKPDDIFDVECPHCGTAVEFWKDEPSVKCAACRKVVVNPKLDLGCAQWCQHAEQCLGTLIDPEDILCKKLIKEMKNSLGKDRQRIDHALAVLRYAQQILTSGQGDVRMVNAAAILHNLEAPCPKRESSAVSGSTNHGELSGVREILFKCRTDSALTGRICELIAAHCRGHVEDSLESRILWDAEWLARLGDHPGRGGADDPGGLIERTFRTEKGRELAATLQIGRYGRAARREVQGGLSSTDT